MSTRSRFLLDIFLFAAFVAAINPTITGIAVHEWLCLIAIAPILWHTIVNWDWVVRTVTRFLERIRAASKLNLLIDALLFVATVAVMVSGLAISQSVLALLGMSPRVAPIWYALHSFSADAVLVLFLLHTTLHLGWLVNAVRYLAGAEASRPARSATPRAVQPQPTMVAPVAAATAIPIRRSAPPAPPAPDHFM